jgi:hypothetical protein
MSWSKTAPSVKQRWTSGAIGNRTVIFAGHGSYASQTDAPPHDTFVVPTGMEVVFWVLHGNPFVGTDLDRRLHVGDFKPQDFNDATPAQDNLSATGRGRSFQIGAHKKLPERYKAGQACPQYRLTPPTGLTPNNRPGDGRFVTVGDRGPLGIGYKLQDLIQMNSGICQNC